MERQRERNYDARRKACDHILRGPPLDLQRHEENPLLRRPPRDIYRDGKGEEVEIVTQAHDTTRRKMPRT